MCRHIYNWNIVEYDVKQQINKQKQTYMSGGVHEIRIHSGRIIMEIHPVKQNISNESKATKHEWEKVNKNERAHRKTSLMENLYNFR